MTTAKINESGATGSDKQEEGEEGIARTQKCYTYDNVLSGLTTQNHAPKGFDWKTDWKVIAQLQFDIAPNMSAVGRLFLLGVTLQIHTYGVLLSGGRSFLSFRPPPYPTVPALPALPLCTSSPPHFLTALPLCTSPLPTVGLHLIKIVGQQKATAKPFTHPPTNK